VLHPVSFDICGPFVELSNTKRIIGKKRFVLFHSRSLNAFELFCRGNVLLLSQIACFNPLLKDSDIDRIEPLLVTFCSLYSMSLVPLHDDEFFHGPPDTAFGVDEISDMIKILRDVCMGIVQFMYPEKHMGGISQSTNATTTAMTISDDESLIVKPVRVHNQNDVARERASKFSLVFKVKRVLFLKNFFY
jgi:hypothetical protein